MVILISYTQYSTERPSNHFAINFANDPSAFIDAMAVFIVALRSPSLSRIPIPIPPPIATGLPTTDNSPFDALTISDRYAASANTASASPLRTAATVSSGVANSTTVAPESATYAAWIVDV